MMMIIIITSMMIIVVIIIDELSGLVESIHQHTFRFELLHKMVWYLYL
jgi:hypothetical protein